MKAVKIDNRQPLLPEKVVNIFKIKEMSMKLFNMLVCALPLSLVAAPIYADEEASDGEATIEVVGDVEAQPEGLTDAISLPEEAAAEARQNAALGLEKANRAREKGEESGQEQAEEAREQGRRNGGFGVDVSVEVQGSGGLDGDTVEGEMGGSADTAINR